jgi:hypothetical protein
MINIERNILLLHSISNQMYSVLQLALCESNLVIGLYDVTGICNKVDVKYNYVVC